MKITRYEDMNYLELDVIREIGSIGTGHAATALSQMLSERVKMTIPDVSILEFDPAIQKMGDYEDIVTAVLVRMSGEIKGLMLFIMKMDFINEITRRLFGKMLNDYSELGEMELSALVEIGNIIISSYINAMSQLAGIDIDLSVPDSAVNMLGGILSVPIAEFGYVTDKLMMIDGKFLIGDRELYGNLLMLPDIDSLNFLMERLGVQHE